MIANIRMITGVSFLSVTFIHKNVFPYRKGSKDYNKCNTLYDWLKDIDIDSVMFQETHFIESKDNIHVYSMQGDEGLHFIIFQAHRQLEVFLFFNHSIS